MRVTDDTARAELSEDEAARIAAEVYIYGYPLVTLEMTRRVTTNTAAPAGMRAPMNQFIHSRQFPPATYRDVPGANVDTLYSAAWLDLAAEPYVLSIPDAEGLYFMMPMMNGWSDVFTGPGTRTTGTKAQSYVITGPRWHGDLPGGVVQYQPATNLVWIIGRTYCTGTVHDYERVHAFQDQLSLVPLGAYGKDYSPPAGRADPGIDMHTPTKDQVIGMDGAAYFTLLAALMKDNPPTAADTAMVEQMAKIGLIPGTDWDAGTLDPAVAKALARAPQIALEKMAAHLPRAGRIVNGWQITQPTGIYGTDYVHRAALNFEGPGWNLAEDAVYPSTRVDSDGDPLSGASRYLIHLASGHLPPATAFWSLTIYEYEGFFVANPLDRVSVSQRDTFTASQDGSIDLYVQHQSPGQDKEANWLPCPEDGFILFMRLYWPDQESPSILDGTWDPPAVQRSRSCLS